MWSIVSKWNAKYGGISVSAEGIELKYSVTSGDYLRGGEASSALKKVLVQLGINPKIIRRVCVSCYEAEMNLVIHSHGGGINAQITKDSIAINVVDSGPGIPDVELAMQEGYSTATETAQNMGFGAGMGLPNIKKNCDELDIKSKVGVGTDIKMKINFK